MKHRRSRSINLIHNKYIFIFSTVLYLLSYGCTKGHFIYPNPDIQIERMKNTVNYLTTITPSRSYDHPNSLKKSYLFILHKFEEYGLKPELQEFVVDGNTHNNVIASVGLPTGDHVIVGAHYDVAGNQPGADDNASAVAGLLEIADFAKKHESELTYRVDFVAYTLEEPPFFKTKNMGSYFHADSLHKNKTRVKGMICLEMIGFYTDQEKSQSYPLNIMRLFYPSTGNYIAVVSNYDSTSFANQIFKHMKISKVDVQMLKAPSFVHGIDFSDHRNYWNFGYNAVMITDTAFYRNPNYHQETDSVDTLDFIKMHEVVKGICWSLLNLK